MSKLLFNEKDIVAPGEILAEGMDYLPGPHTYREGELIISKVMGLVNISGRAIRLTPLSGPYVPKIGDKIIGKVIDITFSGWRVDTNTAYSAMLNVKDATTRFIKKTDDLSKIIVIGEYVVAKIYNVTSQNLIDLTMKEPGLHKVIGGRVIGIGPQKVPRVIGKSGSMIILVKSKTQCEIDVGQNGLIWIKGTPEGEYLAEKAIKYIEEHSHYEGLTDKVEKFLDQELNNK
ncbi:MAG: exosome complex RNA-binding protein Rrp4 [Candidatus Woesearchaeota archaeon]